MKLRKINMRLLAFFLALVLTVSPVCVSATGDIGEEAGNSVATEPVKDSDGQSNSLTETSAGPTTRTTEYVSGGVNWNLDENGTLTISPAQNPEEGYATGEMPADTVSTDAPWYDDLGSITTLIVTEGVTNLGSSMLASATALTTVSLPSSLKSIGQYCFSGCNSLETVVFSSEGQLDLETMGQCVFNACSALETIDLSRTKLEILPRKAFAACPALETVYLPETVNSIVNDCFGSTSKIETENLTAIHYDGMLADWEKVTINSTGNTNLTNGSCNVYCAGDVTWNVNYTSGEDWNYDRVAETLALCFTGAMPDFEEKGAPWYVYASKIVSVDLATSINYVGAYAFDGFAENFVYTYGGNFETLKENSSKVGNTALFDVIVGITGDVTYSLDKITGIMTLSGVGETASYNAVAEFTTEWAAVQQQVKELVVQDGVTKLGSRLFAEAPLLTKATLPASLQTIGARCFTDCTALVEVVFSATTGQLSLAILEEVAFNGCTGLRSIDLSRTQLKTLPRKAFAACPQLTTLSLPEITEIGESCFGSTSNVKTSNLETVYFKDSSAEWSEINVTTTGSGTKNTQLMECTIICSDGIYSVNSNFDAVTYTGDYNAVSGVPLAWKINGTTLELLGYGVTPDFTQDSAPWAEVAASINSVTIDQFITGIGKNAFCGFADNLAYSYSGNFETLKANSSIIGNTALFGGEEPEDDTTLGENIIGGIKWTLENGVLTITPLEAANGVFEPGETPSYNSYDAVPWYNDIGSITTLIVSEGVTHLGDCLFGKLPGLTKVNLPASLKSIGRYCFTECKLLNEVVFPNEGQLNLETLGECVFNACSALETIDLSRTKLETLPRKAFAACSALENIYLPETVNNIVNDCFGSTSNTATKRLEALYFSGTLEAWKDGVYINSTGNTNLTDGTCTVYCMVDNGIWNANYTSMDNLCYKLENGTLSIRVNGAMLNYEDGAAPWSARVLEITAVVFENGTTSVGANAFDGCVNLTDVTICEGLSQIGENAFADCVELTNVHFNGTATQWATLQNASGAGNGPLFSATITNSYSGPCGDNATWEYNQESKMLTITGSGPMWDWHQGTYENNLPWNRFKNEIETIEIGYGITSIGRFAFFGLSAVKTLEFETRDGITTVETIGCYCLRGNETIEMLVLPEGIRFISGRAFSSVSGLKTVYLPSTLESVDMYAFDKVTSIGNVYYNGTEADWGRVYVSTQGGNEANLLPDNNTTWHYLPDEFYTDVATDAWYKEDAYYLRDHGMVPDGNTFGVNETASMDWVLHVLYVRAGSSGAYTDALDWAKTKNIVPPDTTSNVEVSLSALADILYCMTLYNGRPADFGDGTVLDWCQTYISIELAEQTAYAALTRAQAASVLATYLQSTNGSANRYNKMLDEMKEAYETSGGDGRMHILALYHGGTGKVGDSTLILLPGGEVMLIDTFRSDGWQNYLKATLDRLGVKKLDYLVLSHGHDDHDSNLSNVINYIYNAGYTVDNYWSAGSTTSARETAAINLLQEKGNVNIQNRLRAGQQIIIGSGDTQVTVDILWPKESGKGYDGSETNNGSLTMKLSYGDSSYITGGDLFMDCELDILDMYKDNLDILKADVMKTNHHGSYSSNRSEWVDAVNPKVLITHSDDTGDSAQCYEYSRDGRAWFASGRDGGILIVMDDNENISVTTGYDTNLRQYFCAGGEE